MQTYWLTDGSEVLNSESLEEHEVLEKQQEAKEATDGNLFWVSEKPDLPYAETFRHISRMEERSHKGTLIRLLSSKKLPPSVIEDMALNRQAK